MSVKAIFGSIVLTLVTVQTALAHPSLTPHFHVSDGGLHVSWLEILAGLTAAGLAFAYYRYRQAHVKKERVGRK